MLRLCRLQLKVTTTIKVLKSCLYLQLVTKNELYKMYDVCYLGELLNGPPLLYRNFCRTDAECSCFGPQKCFICADKPCLWLPNGYHLTKNEVVQHTKFSSNPSFTTWISIIVFALPERGSQRSSTGSFRIKNLKEFLLLIYDVLTS